MYALCVLFEVAYLLHLICLLFLYSTHSTKQNYHRSLSTKLSTLLAQYMMKKDELAIAFDFFFFWTLFGLYSALASLPNLLICICPFLKEKEHFQVSSRRVHSSGED
jgi:cytochrome c oxidase subunit IV